MSPSFQGMLQRQCISDVELTIKACVNACGVLLSLKARVHVQCAPRAAVAMLGGVVAAGARSAGGRCTRIASWGTTAWSPDGGTGRTAPPTRSRCRLAGPPCPRSCCSRRRLTCKLLLSAGSHLRSTGLCRIFCEAAEKAAASDGFGTAQQVLEVGGFPEGRIPTASSSRCCCRVGRCPAGGAGVRQDGSADQGDQGAKCREAPLRVRRRLRRRRSGHPRCDLLHSAETASRQRPLQGAGWLSRAQCLPCLGAIFQESARGVVV